MKILTFALLPLAGMALAISLPAQKSSAPTGGRFAQGVRPFLQQHCMACHSGPHPSAGMTMEPFLQGDSLGRDPDSWRQFVLKIRTGQMPPPGSPRPDPKQAKEVTDWILAELNRLEQSVKPSAGRVTARRLNRAEYDNTIRDLLGVDIHPAADFPQDDSGYGFDNIGDALSVSPPLMEKYLVAAEHVARTALFGPEQRKPRLIELKPARREPPEPPKIPSEYDRTGLTLPQAVHALYRFPADGRYEIHAVLTGLRPATADPVHFALWIDGKKRLEQTYAPQGIPSFPGGPQELYGQKVLFPRLAISAGEHWIAVAIERLYEGLPPSFDGPNPSQRPEPKLAAFRLPEPPADATPEQKREFEVRRKRFEEFSRNQRAQLPGSTRVGSLEIGGPYEQRQGVSPQSQALIFVCGHRDGRHTADCPRRILADIAARAFRRPITPRELAPYLRLYAQSRHEGDSFNEALCVSLQALLVSPNFLFRIEHDPAPGSGPRPLNDHELASRLSFFLWSTMPDETLRHLADVHVLHRPEVLKAQTLRMLRDPKAAALVENFGGQWLELRKLESVTPDRQKFDTFDEYLRLSMRRETELFFEEIVRSDRSILDFLDGRYTYVNQRLAEFYGIPGIRGPEFRRVALNAGQAANRGGILTQASILTVTSYPNRTSPVLRGKWILENLLGTPPPPPPPGVPGLEETKVPAGASLRQQLEAHRKKPLCASCHARLDPLGFGLENFNGVGAWRTIDGATPVEASGTLPDGRKFTGPQELSAVLKEDSPAFARCLTTKLLTYALGRGVERYDRPAIQQIVARVGRDDYRFSSLVIGIVTSLPFQQREGVISHELRPTHISLASNAAAGRRSRAWPAVSRGDEPGIRRAKVR